MLLLDHVKKELKLVKSIDCTKKTLHVVVKGGGEPFHHGCIPLFTGSTTSYRDIMMFLLRSLLELHMKEGQVYFGAIENLRLQEDV